MERIVLIAMGWLFVVGGAIFLGILVEHLLHRRKMARLDINFDRMNFDSSAADHASSDKARQLRRSA
ncbi:MAG: hypothetical protein QGD90_02390 [Candidatus Hydrogenedentes bacterium]|nr:hypothetical protein [Candidatus Hydrogenedentota bacterium]